ncbi:hypothetical protein HMI01_26710 [Halolactibacillus miurensis]|uniref:DUF4845 domain-containing protein n=2 Tax=Halolactibacillus miurensis TaxID=306541 RepID=A0A1I6U3A3_9BACI|nr:hypothetical protein [Halolactibacillus miurensis]GEM05683.1 hypothetical protein HMI01_26710 [Halolactibacillus miurensis]SFS95905.1 hypothetical protein SAMN05421668_12133 [Halolactibacillus miurensis]
MIEGSVMNVGKIYMTMLLVALIVTISVFLFHVQQSNHFKQYINYQIERSGGLTLDTIDRINQYSEQNFSGVFSLDDSQQTEKKPYGETVEYQANVSIKFLFLDFDIVELPISGSAISLVR